jgi:peptidoglycan/LPS O-acetylase OafA/YrhL
VRFEIAAFLIELHGMKSTAPSAPITARRVPQIDGLRALGMLMVFLFHSWEFGGTPVWHVTVLGRETNMLGFLSNFGTGVDLFMVISGFCLFWPLCKSTEALRTWEWRPYFKHRIRRIVPPYYAAIGYAVLLPMVLVVLFRSMKIAANWQPIPSAWQLFTHLLFIHSMFPGTWNGITGAFWSLGLEAQFYVLFPLAVFGYRRGGVKVIWWMIAASVFIRIVGAAVIPSFNWRFVLSISCFGRWMEFGAGMLTALAVAKDWREERTHGALTGAAQVAGAFVLYVLATVWATPSVVSRVPIYEVLLSTCFALLILALCTSRTPVARFAGSPVAVWLGGISYSIYLIHQPTAWYLSEFLKKKLHLGGIADLCLLATVGFAVVVAVGYPFFLVFEKPGTTNRFRKKNDAIQEAPADGAGIKDTALNCSTQN